MKISNNHQTMRLSAKGFLVICLASALGLVGCEKQGAAEKAGQNIDKAATSAGTYMDDAAITAKIKADILSDPSLKVFQINVTTTNAVVKLSGVVDSQQSIDRAAEIARSNRNVQAVDNSLMVKTVK